MFHFAADPNRIIERKEKFKRRQTEITGSKLMKEGRN